MGRLIVSVLGVVFVVAGYLVGIWFGKPILDNAKASTDWPTTQGEVIESKLEHHRGSSGKKGRRGPTYSVHVVYRYSLDGADLESDRVWFGGDYSTSDRAGMQAVVREYPVGSRVTVYYAPDNPGLAVLKPGAFVSSYLCFGIGTAFLVLGSVMLLGVFMTLLRGLGQSVVGDADDSFGDQSFDNMTDRANDFDDFSNPHENDAFLN